MVTQVGTWGRFVPTSPGWTDSPLLNLPT